MKFYLEQLIYALNDSDIERLRSIELKKSKIKTYLEILIEKRKAGIIDKEVIMAKLDLDENSFKKMRSVLMTKSLTQLAPEGGIVLLEFLSRYRLREIFGREAEDVIKKMKKKKSISRDEKSKIYFQCVMGYMRLPYTLFNEEELEKYLEGFLKNYDKPDKLIFTGVVKCYSIFIQIVKSFFRMETTEENYNHFMERINAVMEKAVRMKNVRLKAFAESLRLILDFYYTAKWEELENGLDKVIETYSRLTDPGTQDELFAIKFYRSYIEVMKSDYPKANELFRRLEEENKELFPQFPYVIFRNAISLQMAGDNKESKRLLDQYLKKNILVYDTDNAVLSCVAFTTYHLLENELDSASKYIDLFWKLVNKKEMMVFEFSIRLSEIVYFYQRGDSEFAAGQFKRLTRYLEEKAKRQGILNVSDRIKILSRVFDKFLKGKMELNQFEEELRNLFQRSSYILGALFINAARVRNKSLSA